MAVCAEDGTGPCGRPGPLLRPEKPARVRGGVCPGQAWAGSGSLREFAPDHAVAYWFVIFPLYQLCPAQRFSAGLQRPAEKGGADTGAKGAEPEENQVLRFFASQARECKAGVRLSCPWALITVIGIEVHDRFSASCCLGRRVRADADGVGVRPAAAAWDS
ncbi:uncharacterized protein LOC143682943 [Tamandua tetradactyla]|uniref:uncharacterized protein LOC143682943 n=1 Tax=Tamandua tetradactyla TaxID=48850 RepID=UPI004053D791